MSRRIIAGCAATIIVLVGLTSIFGERGGENQFSPFTLDRRGREYLYFAGVPVYASRWSYHRDCLSQFLVGAGYWTPADAADPRWISMSSFRGRSPGETRLDIELSSDWMVWSAKHPDLADLLWPFVLTILRGPPLEYDGIGVVSPEFAAASLLMKIRRVSNLPDLQRDLDLFERLTKPAPGGGNQTGQV